MKFNILKKIAPEIKQTVFNYEFDFYILNALS